MAQASRKAVIVILANVVGAFGGAASLFLIGQYFEPQAWGSYIFAFSVGGIFAIVSNLGLGAAHQRHLAQGADPGRAFAVLLRMRLVLGLAVLAVFLAVLLFWLSRRPVLTDSTTPQVLAAALIVQILSSVRQMFLDTWQGQQRVSRVEGIRLLDTALVVLFLANGSMLVAHLQGKWEAVPGIGAFWASRLGMEGSTGVEGAALILASCYLMAKFLTLALAAAWFLREKVSWGPWDRELARSYVNYALPFALAGTLALVLQYTDSLMLGYFWTKHEVGIYGGAQRPAALCLLATVAVATVLFPRFSQLHAAGDIAGEAATFRNSERYMLLVVAPLAAAMVALPNQGLHIIGDGYLEAAWPLRFLAMWAIVTTLAQPLASWFMGAGKMSVIVRSTVISAVGNITLNLALIPRWAAGWGPEGAAVATLASTAMSYAYLRFAARRAYRIPWVDLHQLRILLGAVAAIAFWLLALRLAGEAAFDRAWELALWGLAGLTVYATTLVASRELRKTDFAAMRRMTHPRQLLAEMQGR